MRITHDVQPDTSQQLHSVQHLTLILLQLLYVIFSPESPGLAFSTRRRRANDEKNAHRMLAAMSAAVIVMASVTSSVTHAMLAPDIRRSINERSHRFDWDDHCEDLDERGPDCFRRQYRMPQQTFE